MASKGVNKVILVGNLGQDPEVRYMPNGGAVVNLSLATSDTWTDKQTGDKKSALNGTGWFFTASWPKLPVSICVRAPRYTSKVHYAPANGRISLALKSTLQKWSSASQVRCRCWADEIVREVGSNRAAGVSLSNQQRLLTAGCHLNSILQMSRQWTSTMISRSRRSGTVWPDMRFMCCPENCR